MSRDVKTVSVEEVVAFLNRLLELENEAMQKLFNVKVPVKDPEAMARIMPLASVDGRPAMSFLGMLNGMFAGGDRNLYPIGMDILQGIESINFRYIKRHQ